METWRILVVDDDQDVARNTAALISGALPDLNGTPAQTKAEFETSFERALAAIENGNFDLLVLDVRDQSLASHDIAAGSADLGIEAYSEVRARRFIPIVFYTALPHLVENLSNPPFVGVVSKLGVEPIDELRAAVQVAFTSALPAINRGLNRHVERVTRDFMINFVEQHWDQLGEPVRKGDLVHLLLRRLGVSLSAGAEVLAGEIGDSEGFELSPEAVHPMRLYIVPPVGDHMTGDLLMGPRVQSMLAGDSDVPSEADDSDEWWYVVLTPACDLVSGRVKAEYVVMAECVGLNGFDEFTDWTAALAAAKQDVGHEPTVRTARKNLRRLIQNNTNAYQADRFHYLPAAWLVPDLLVDLQRLVHIKYEDLQQYDRAATLDSPYAEALMSRLGRYLGRLGAPDLDVDITIGRLEPQVGAE